MRRVANAPPADAERLGERHPVDVAARRGPRPVHVGVRVDPEHAARAVHPRHASERPHRDRVVAAEHERQEAGLARLGDPLGDRRARAHDRAEIARVRIADVGRFRQRLPRRRPSRRRDGRGRRSRSWSPAYRIAEGPMSTPRRPWPRSSPAPITATGVEACELMVRRLTSRRGRHVSRLRRAVHDEGRFDDPGAPPHGRAEPRRGLGSRRRRGRSAITTHSARRSTSCSKAKASLEIDGEAVVVRPRRRRPDPAGRVARDRRDEPTCAFSAAARRLTRTTTRISSEPARLDWPLEAR